MKTTNELEGMLVGEEARLKNCEEQLKERNENLINVKARIDLLKYILDIDQQLAYEK